MLRIDPHAHTLCSDGTNTPDELVVAAQEAQLDYVGITDHDTTEGWGLAEKTAKELGIGLIPGVEFSSQWQGRPVHILGLYVDPNYSPLQAEFQRAKNSRATRLQRMMQKMVADFPKLSWQELEEQAAGAPMGRPHLADQLVRLGYVHDRSEAFESILAERGPYWEPQDMLEPAAATALICASGGVPIMAHPRAVKRSRPVPQEVIQEMVEAGLFGLERDHRDHGPEDRAEVDRLARHFGLVVTGGSDYHGTGKPNLLGENLTSPEVFAQIVEQASSQGVAN